MAEQHQAQFQVGLQAGRDRGLSLPRPAAHLRKPLYYAGWRPESVAGNPGPFGHQNDHALCSSEQGAQGGSNRPVEWAYIVTKY